MIKKSIQAYVYYFIASFIMSMFIPNMRMVMLHSPFITGLTYCIGASVFFAVPGMINFWLDSKRGYVKWGRLSMVTGISTMIIVKICFPGAGFQFMFLMACIMAIPAAIAQYLVLVHCMRLKTSRPKSVGSDKYMEIDPEIDLEKLLTDGPNMEEGESYRKGE